MGPGLDPAVGKKAIQQFSYDRRVSPAVIEAFKAPADDELNNTLKGAPRLIIPDQFALSFMNRRAQIESGIFQRPAAA